MNALFKRSGVTGAAMTFVAVFGIAACAPASVPIKSDASSSPAHTAECNTVGGTLGGAVIGGATGSLFGSGSGRLAASIGGALIGGALGSRRDAQARANCIAENESARDRDVQRQLEFERQRQLQEEQVRREIEEQRLFEEWQRERNRG